MGNTKYVLSWSDPDETDRGIDTGFEEFESEGALLQWLDNKVKYCPNLSYSAYSVFNKIEIKAKEIAIKHVVIR